MEDIDVNERKRFFSHNGPVVRKISRVKKVSAVDNHKLRRVYTFEEHRDWFHNEEESWQYSKHMRLLHRYKVKFPAPHKTENVVLHWKNWKHRDYRENRTKRFRDEDIKDTIEEAKRLYRTGYFDKIDDFI